MCGIVGVLDSAPVDDDIVCRMRDRLAHRGPDAEGLWRLDSGRVVLGHRRLAILDLSPAANQPFISGDGRFVITFNGEIYNFRTLRQELELRGVRFRTECDTEVLIEAYREWGEACLPRLSGMFAFGIWDIAERRLFLARDRAGEKPLYYALAGTAFVFASELKALLEWPAFSKRLNYSAVADFLTYGFVPDPKTVWHGASKLPAGHSMVVRTRPDGSPESDRPTAWWDMRFEPDESVEDWRPVILETLERSAAEMTVADVPLGAFLSGGVDSSSVVAALRRGGTDVRSFTIGFADNGYDERPWARQVAERYSTRHVERLVEATDVDAVFDKLLWHFDEPFNDYSYLPTFYVCQQARASITVALSGDGGDEVFAGYRKYQRLVLREGWARLLPRSLARTASVVLPRHSSHRRTLTQYGADIHAMLVDMFTLGIPSTRLRDAARGALARTLSDYRPDEVVLDLVRTAPPHRVGLVNTMRYLDLKLTLGSGILTKVDRASMAVSLEVRPVYLHRDMLDLASRIPARLLADTRQAKKVLKSALEAWLPDSVLYRRKMGFAMPLKNWLRGDITHAFGPRNDGVLGDIIDPSLLARLIDAHSSGVADCTAQIHSLVFLDRWLRKWT